MTKLIFSKKYRIISIACGIILTAGFLLGFLYFVINKLNPAVTWALMFPLFLMFSTLSVLSIREAFYAYCIFDDEAGIEFYSGYAKVKKIPVDMLDSFMPVNDGIVISYKLYNNNSPKVKEIKVSSYFKNIDLLYEWLDSHARNIYKEQVIKSIEEFREAHSELKDKEKAKLYQKNQKIAKILKIAGIIIALLPVASILLNVNWLKICFVVCAAYPVFLIILLRFFNGEIRFNEKTTDIHPSVFPPFLFCSASLMFIACVYIDMIYSFSKNFTLAALITLALLILYFFCANESEKNIGEKKSVKVWNCISLTFIFFMYGIGLTMPGNIMFDKSEPVVYESTVVDQRVSHGKNTDYYLKISPWINEEKEFKEVSVGKTLYSKVQIGNIVYVKLYKGYFGVPWFRVTGKA